MRTELMDGSIKTASFWLRDIVMGFNSDSTVPLPQTLSEKLRIDLPGFDLRLTMALDYRRRKVVQA